HLLPFSFPRPTRYTHHPLSLHDALPISKCATRRKPPGRSLINFLRPAPKLSLSRPKSMRGDVAKALSRMDFKAASNFAKQPLNSDRKSTRLNSSHRTISYAVFCLKKKNT